MRWHLQEFIFAVVVTLFGVQGASARDPRTYVFPANCSGSYTKQGEPSDDLTKVAGRPFQCDSIVLSLIDGGRVAIQFATKAGKLTPMGFVGTGFDYDINSNLATVRLDRLMPPHAGDPKRAQVFDSATGYCFLEGKINVRQVTGIACAAKLEIGTQRLVYHVESKTSGVGVPME